MIQIIKQIILQFVQMLCEGHISNINTSMRDRTTLAKMKLLLLVFAVCAVGKATIQTSQLLNFGCYWRDWDVNTPIPEDAVGGGVDSDGHLTYVARSVYNKNGIIVAGKASPQAKKMWFEHRHLEHSKTKDIEILCELNKNRLKWVVANEGDTVDKVVGDNVLISGGSDGVVDTTIGRQIIGNEIQVGKVGISNGKFVYLHLCQNGKGWSVLRGYEVLVYDKNESVDT